jgi:hypothetical protein
MLAAVSCRRDMLETFWLAILFYENNLASRLNIPAMPGCMSSPWQELVLKLAPPCLPPFVSSYLLIEPPLGLFSWEK